VALRSQGVRIVSPPVNVPPQLVYVQGPPVYVDAPPVNVAPAQIYLEAPNVRVRPSEVTVAPPEIHYTPAQPHPEDDCCTVASGASIDAATASQYQSSAYSSSATSGETAYINGQAVPAYNTGPNQFQ
jgi:hypothetical protein